MAEILSCVSQKGWYYFFHSTFFMPGKYSRSGQFLRTTLIKNAVAAQTKSPQKSPEIQGQIQVTIGGVVSDERSEIGINLDKEKSEAQ